MIEVKKYGACTEDFLPFDEKQVLDKPPQEAYKRALTYKKYIVKKSEELNIFPIKAGQVLTCIQNYFPVYISMVPDDNFQSFNFQYPWIIQ